MLTNKLYLANVVLTNQQVHIVGAMFGCQRAKGGAQSWLKDQTITGQGDQGDQKDGSTVVEQLVGYN